MLWTHARRILRVRNGFRFIRKVKREWDTNMSCRDIRDAHTRVCVCVCVHVEILMFEKVWSDIILFGGIRRRWFGSMFGEIFSFYYLWISLKKGLQFFVWNNILKKEENVHLYMEIYVIRKMVGKFKNCFWDLSFRGIGIFIILLIIPLRFFSIIWDFYNVFDYPKRGYKFLFAKISVNILRTDFSFSYYNDHYYFFFSIIIFLLQLFNIAYTIQKVFNSLTESYNIDKDDLENND